FETLARHYLATSWSCVAPVGGADRYGLGGLMATVLGGRFGVGRPLTKRPGVISKAAESASARVSSFSFAPPVCISAGVSRARLSWRCSLLYHWKNSAHQSCASSLESNHFGYVGLYFSVLNCDSEKALSLLVRGREWLRSTPSDSNR